MQSKQSSASPFSRACLVAYVMLIIYASWYPFSGWQFETIAAYLAQIQQWPHYWTKFDAIINVIGYMPLGALIVFSCYPNWSRSWSICIATLGAGLLGFTMESVQFFLPSRVTSLLDMLTNGFGGFLGAITGAYLLSPILENGRLHELKNHWLQKDSPREMVVLGLWPLAQIYPLAFLFGHGQILPIISLWCEEYLDISIDLGSFLRNGIELSAEVYLISETIITACGCAGAVLFFLSLLSRQAPKFALSCSLLIGALSIRLLASALMFEPENAFIWLAPGAQGGILIGILMLYGFSFAPHQVQRRLAALLLIISVILVNLIPSNPYFLNTLQTMVQGKMLNFYGAAQFLAIVWPFAAIWYLLKLQKNIKR
jgi:VanZ family protein